MRDVSELRDQVFFAVFFVITAGIVIIGYRLDPAAGILAAFSACMYGILFFVFTKERYKNIAQLSDEIDQVLHSAEKIYIADSREGELSVLKSEITKMTIRIREQNRALKKKRNGCQSLWLISPISLGRLLLLPT